MERKQITHSKCPAFSSINYGSLQFHIRSDKSIWRIEYKILHEKWLGLGCAADQQHAIDFSLFLWQQHTNWCCTSPGDKQCWISTEHILICDHYLSRHAHMCDSSGHEYDGHAIVALVYDIGATNEPPPNNFIFQLKLNVDTDWMRLAAAKATNSFNVYYG